MNVIIVDDEPLAHEVLETYINQVSGLNLVKKCYNALEAREVIDKMQVDLMFLDIQMPQLTGLEFVKSMTKLPLVVFTTAYAEYALESYEIDAVDYLIKPVSLEKFLKAINKAQERYEAENSEAIDGFDHFFVKADKKLVKLFYNDILYIEGLKDYVIIKTETGRVITLQTMKSLEERLANKNFKRVHRSYILNKSKIKALLGNVVEIVENGKEKHIPIGKNYRDELFEEINSKKI
jgi:DNA-binding LytR/AlgR family response regulator